MNISKRLIKIARLAVSARYWALPGTAPTPEIGFILEKEFGAKVSPHGQSRKDRIIDWFYNVNDTPWADIVTKVKKLFPSSKVKGNTITYVGKLNKKLGYKEQWVLSSVRNNRSFRLEVGRWGVPEGMFP